MDVIGGGENAGAGNLGDGFRIAGLVASAAESGRPNSSSIHSSKEPEPYAFWLGLACAGNGEDAPATARVDPTVVMDCRRSMAVVLAWRRNAWQATKDDGLTYASSFGA
jgi:hypothetical protein